jgi:D-3-phosphoglycerate dehydrogenase
MYNICLFEKIADSALEYLKKNAQLYILSDPYHFDIDINVKKNLDAIIIRAKGAVSGKIIDECPNLKVIGRHGVGVDNIDLDAARKKRIKVINTPEANYQSVAEFVVGLMLAMARNLFQADNFVKTNQNWLANHSLVGTELHNKTVGIIGAGRVGTRLAEILGYGFNMQVLLYDYKHRRRHFKIGTKIKITADLPAVLANADFLSVNIPSNDMTRNMLNRFLLDKLKPGCCVINTARGDVADQEYLIRLCKEKKIRGLALDVFTGEPFVVPEELRYAPNFLATPHIAYLTEESLFRMSAIAFTVIETLQGKK